MKSCKLNEKTSMIIIKIWNKIFSLNVTIKIFFIIMYKVFLLVTLIHCHGKRERQKEVEGRKEIVEWWKMKILI